jgi:hypothetical protein
MTNKYTTIETTLTMIKPGLLPVMLAVRLQRPCYSPAMTSMKVKPGAGTKTTGHFAW